MRRTGLFVLLVAATGCSGGKWREVDARLLSASQEARRAGFLPLSGPYNTFGSYRDVLDHTWRVSLDARTPYVVATACTDGCDSLAIRIAAPGGSPVTGARAAGAWPVVAFTAADSGAYAVSFRGRCAAPRCWWVAQVYARGGAGTLRPGFAGGRR
jgi:hypothetical protein